MKAFTLLLVSAALLSEAAPVLAQPQNVCRPDAERLCATQVAARDRQAAKACLMKNMDKLSDACRARIKQSMDRGASKGG